MNEFFNEILFIMGPMIFYYIGIVVLVMYVPIALINIIMIVKLFLGVRNESSIKQEIDMAAGKFSGNFSKTRGPEQNFFRIRLFITFWAWEAYCLSSFADIPYAVSYQTIIFQAFMMIFNFSSFMLMNFNLEEAIRRNPNLDKSGAQKILLLFSLAFNMILIFIVINTTLHSVSYAHQAMVLDFIFGAAAIMFMIGVFAYWWGLLFPLGILGSLHFPEKNSVFFQLSCGVMVVAIILALFHRTFFSDIGNF